MRAFLFISLLAAGCTGYSPDLGPEPFLCGDEDEGPRCPEGYSCEINGTEEICVEGEGNGDDSSDDNTDDDSLMTDDSDDSDDSNGFQCANDGDLEPNDTTSDAYVTDAATTMRIFGPLSICPATDKDLFEIALPGPSTMMKAITVTVTWDSGTAMSGAILGAGGQVLKPLVAAGERAIRECAKDLPGGAKYYAQVAGTAQNNYRIQLQTTDTCAAP
jgi:hypothetical protein